MSAASCSIFKRLPVSYLIVPAVLGLSAPSSQASLIATESFNYLVRTPINTQGNDAGWSATGEKWNGATTAIIDGDSPLSFSNLATSGNHLEVQGNGQGVYRDFGSTYSTTGNTYWFSMLIRIDNAVGTSYGGVSLFTGTGTEHFFYGQRNGNGNWGMEQHAALGANSTVSAANNSVAFSVLELIGGTGTGQIGTAKLYVNPTSLGSAAPSTSSATLSFTNFSFDTYRVQSGGTQRTVEVGDNFRGVWRCQTVTEVVTPTSGSLMTAGGLKPLTSVSGPTSTPRKPATICVCCNT